MSADTPADQDGENGPSRDVDAAAVQTLARAAGLALDKQRARIVAPFVTDTLRADAALARLDMGDVPAAGMPWGRGHDDG